MIRSVPELLGAALGTPGDGPHRCFYCGAACGEDHPAAIHVKDSFNGRAGARSPGSPWVCAGCVLCLREACDVDLIDGTRRTLTKCAMRAWSWVVTPHAALAASKAHLDRLRAICLDPPAPPFALVLSDSGQTHQLYRGVVNHARDPAVATLEGDPIPFRPADLAARLALCGRLVAATGKPALGEPVSARFAIAVMDRYRDGESLVIEWNRVREQPLSRLAAWLTPNKDTCHREHPSDIEPTSPPADPGHRGIPPQAGGSGRSRPRDGPDREGGGARGGQPLLFHPGPPVQ